MKIRLAKSAGFCFGVKRALDIALCTARSGNKVYMLGDIVHNEDVIRNIQRSGIKKIEKLSDGNGNTLLIRAHGIDRATISRAGKLGYKIVDATCPMVKEIHKIAREMEKNGYTVIIIGEKKHDEVRGIIGQLDKRPLVLENIRDISIKKLGGIKKAGVVVQSTQDLNKVIRMKTKIEKIVPYIVFNNTICNPTRTKQKEAQIMPRENDVMIIIGSRSSANTKRLYLISKNINPRTHWINSREEICSKWFVGAKTVGISAGASTPEETIKDIIGFLRKL